MNEPQPSADKAGQRSSPPSGSALADAAKLALDALQYGGVGDDRPHNKLILLLEAERSKYRGDNWDYWNYLSEKLQQAEHALTVVVNTPNAAMSDRADSAGWNVK